MARKKDVGEKLNHSGIIQARLDPKLHMAADIMARSQKRNLSNLIESLIESSIDKYKVSAITSANAQMDVYLFGDRKSDELSVKEIINKIWSTEEADRFAMFCFLLPDLLSAEELRLWELIVDTAYFWGHFIINIEGKNGKLLKKLIWPAINEHSLLKENLREYWPLLKEIFDGKKSAEELKQLNLPEGEIIENPNKCLTIKKIEFNS